MDSLKTWLIEVGIKKMGPSAIRAALAGFIGIVVSHTEVLAKFGVIYDQTNHILSVHLNTLQEWCDVSGLGLIAAIVMAAQHHVGAAITGAPQTGEKNDTSK